MVEAVNASLFFACGDHDCARLARKEWTMETGPSPDAVVAALLVIYEDVARHPEEVDDDEVALEDVA